MTDKSIQLKDASDNNLFPITNYNNNINIPSINGVPLIGNKTLEEIAGASKGIKLLWENPSPTATFAAQTISISEDLTKYDFFLVSYGADATNYYLQTAIIWLGKQSQLFYMTWGGARYQRNITINDTSLVFGNASSNNSTSNGVAVPYQVYGIKNTGITSETISNKELLWSNPSPTSEFAAQTITLTKSATDFDTLMVVMQYANTNTSTGISFISTSGINEIMVGQNNGAAISKRDVTVSDKSVTFSTGRYNAASSEGSAASMCVPIAIYGLYFGSKIINEYTYSLPNINDSNLTDLTYPIGSIYESSSSANPGTIVGGTWEQINDTIKRVWAPSGSIASNGTFCQLTLEAGTYLIGGYNASTSGSLWLRVNDVFQDTNSKFFLKCTYNSGWSKVVVFSTNSTICYQNSNGSAITSQIGTQLYAIRLDASGSTIYKWRRTS